MTTTISDVLYNKAIEIQNIDMSIAKTLVCMSIISMIFPVTNSNMNNTTFKKHIYFSVLNQYYFSSY